MVAFMASGNDFNLSDVFATVAGAVPDQTFVTWRGRRFTYAEVDRRVTGFANYLASVGLGCRTERTPCRATNPARITSRSTSTTATSTSRGCSGRTGRASHRSTSTTATSRRSCATCSTTPHAAAVVYHAEFAPRSPRSATGLPDLRRPAPGRRRVGQRPAARSRRLRGRILATPAPDAGLADAVARRSLHPLHRWHHGHAQGRAVAPARHLHVGDGRPAVGQRRTARLLRRARRQGTGGGRRMSIMMIPPLMHGAAQWAAFNTSRWAGAIVIPDDVERIDPPRCCDSSRRRRCNSLTVVGDAIARPLIEETRAGRLRPVRSVPRRQRRRPADAAVRERAAGRAAARDAARIPSGSSETGAQMSTMTHGGGDGRRDVHPAVRARSSSSRTSTGCSSRVRGHRMAGATRTCIPLGYLGDEAKTARTFPVIDGVR